MRDFFILTGLANADEIVEENPPTNESRRAVDLTALDTFVEFKRRIGTAGGFNPDPANVAQIDEYLELSKSASKGVRTGILTDGKYWLLRWPDAGPVRTERPYGFVLDDPDQWVPLFEWLRDTALLSLDNIPADRTTIERILGPVSPTYQRDIDTLTALYRGAAGSETVRVKRRLWEDLLRAALGEVAGTAAALDDLFVRPHLPQRRDWHSRAGFIRRRNLPAFRIRSRGSAPWTRFSQQDRLPGDRGIGFLRLAHGGRRPTVAEDACSPGSQVRLAAGTQ